MLHIKPLTEADASEKVLLIYKDIMGTFDVPVVPLVFQYVARYPEYFEYLWTSIKPAVESRPFAASFNQIHTFSRECVQVVYQPSSFMQEFIQKLAGIEKEHIINTIDELSILNAKLMLITIAVRESIKGMQVGVQKISSSSNSPVHDAQVFNDFLRQSTRLEHENKEVAHAARMLIPVFGTNMPVLSRYPDFFNHVAKEMDRLLKTEAYLKTRVEMERLGHQLLRQFSSSMTLSYRETILLLRNKAHTDELIYLLQDMFPSQFPRLVITSSVMERCINL